MGKNLIAKCTLATLGILLPALGFTYEWDENDFYLSEATHTHLLEQINSPVFSSNTRPYLVINAKNYKNTVVDTREKITILLEQLNSQQNLSADAKVAWITQQLLNIPYIESNGMGEGDWQPRSSVYKGGALHVKQNPVYRLDGLNCQTFVQIVMALFHSRNINQFDKNILKISYGAAGNPDGEIVRFYNRNNFIDGDFNPVNQRNGWLTDVTREGTLARYAKPIEATITRQKWFAKQLQNPEANVQVLDAEYGPAMAKRFKNVYARLPFPNFDSEQITLHYIPKQLIALRQSDGSFLPNQTLLDKIPTPAVMEIVRDIKKWKLYGVKMKDIIGSELTVSHMGLLYRQRFNQGDVIYDKTSCQWDYQNRKVCSVTPVICKKETCNELMYAHATDAYPKSYYWYQTADGHSVCTPRLPSAGTPYTRCNRVVAMPLYAYFTDYQLGSHWNMDMPSLLGVHIEQLS